MRRHAAFLRAINVGGRRVTNAQLVEAVEQAGFDDVGSFLASGNVMYAPGTHDPVSATSILEATLAEHLGFTTEVFVRTAEDLDAIIRAQPFDAEALDAAPTAPQIGFLQHPVDPDAVHAYSTDVDRLAVIGAELHWLPMQGVGRAALDHGAIARITGPMTVRSLNTVTRIRAKLG